MKRVCIHQPDFAPWLGFFDRLLDVDVLIILDDAQFLRRGWHHRDKIKTRSGSDWLTLSVAKAEQRTPINEIRLQPDRESWVPGNLGLLVENYRAAPAFETGYPAIEALYRQPFDKMVDLNMAFLHHAFAAFDIDVEVAFASSLGVSGARTQRLVDLVKAVDGTHYLSGTGALDYLEPELFEQAGIGLEIQRFRHPVHPQLHGEFVSHLSCIDALLNTGAAARDVLRSTRE